MASRRKLAAVGSVVAFAACGLVGSEALSAGATGNPAPTALAHVAPAPLSPLAASPVTRSRVLWQTTTPGGLVADATSIFVGSVVGKGDSFQLSNDAPDAPPTYYHKVRFSVSAVFRGSKVDTVDVVVLDGNDMFVPENQYVVYAAQQALGGQTCLVALNQYGAFVVGADKATPAVAWGDGARTSTNNPLKMAYGVPTASVDSQRSQLQSRADSSSGSMSSGSPDSSSPVSPLATASYQACTGDCRTGAEWWYISGGVPSGWYSAIIDGALVWDHVTNQSHNFHRQASITGAQINVYRSSNLPGDTLAWTTYGSMMTIAINGNHPWWTDVNSAPPGSTLHWDLWSVMAHEFGHTLELDEAQHYVTCSNYAASVRPTMCTGLGVNAIWPRSLETYDKNHERNLYG